MGKRRNKTNTINTLKALKNISTVAQGQMQTLQNNYKGQLGTLKNANPLNYGPNFNFKDAKRNLDQNYRLALFNYIESMGTIIKPMELKLEGKDNKEIIQYASYLMMMTQHLSPQDKADFLRQELEESDNINLDLAIRKCASVIDQTLHGEDTLSASLELNNIIADSISDQEKSAEIWNSMSEQLQAFKDHSGDFIEQELANMTNDPDHISIIENFIVGTINNTVYNVAKSEGIQPDILADEQPVEE